MNAESISRYRAEFARLETQFPGADLLWLHQTRCAAFNHFSTLGFPTTAQEDWKYTNVSMIEKRAFKSTAESQDGVSRSQVGELALSDDYLFVYINGRYAPAFSGLKALPHGVTVVSLAAALADHSAHLEALHGCTSAAATNGFAALNTAFWMDGAYIALAPAVVIEAPLHLLFITTEADLVTHPRNIIHVGAGARATIV